MRIRPREYPGEGTHTESDGRTRVLCRTLDTTRRSAVLRRRSEARCFQRAHADRALAAAFSDLFWPTFVEFRGCVLLQHRYEPVNFERWWEATGGDARQVESVLNHTHIWDLFEGNEVADEAEALFAETLAKTWRAALREQFPKREMTVYVTNSEDDYGPTLHVVSHDAQSEGPSRSGTRAPLR
jgi:hypothetical protein